MTSPSQTRWWFPAAVLALPLLLVSSVCAQSVYLVSKTQIFRQTSASGTVPDPNGAFAISASAPAAATLTLPAGATVPLTSPGQGGGEWKFEAVFPTKAALDAAYPNGTYRVTGAGIPALSFNFSTDAYPAATPQVTGGTWNAGGLLVVDPAQATTINFSTFTGFATSGLAGHMEIDLQGITDDVELQSQLASRAIFGLPASSTPLTTFSIPAGRLTSGRAYEVQINFDTLTTLDSTSIPGGGAVALFQKVLKFYVAAQSPGTTTPAPVIATQPTNQTAPLGGRATFPFVLAVGGAGQNNIIPVFWYFNGNAIRPDGTKYGLAAGTNLVVNNVTAADVGTYYAVAINAGGVVTSNSATLAIGAAQGGGTPVINLQPLSRVMTTGGTVVFSASATGATSYQWRRDGTPIAGANTPLLVLSGPNVVAGAYSVVVSNAAGESTTSNNAQLTIAPANTEPGRLLNLSILTQLTAGEKLTMGTVLGGTGTSGSKPLLVRAVGPSLSQLNVQGFLPDPTMTLINTSASTTVATNNDWAGAQALVAAFAQVAAFPFTGPASKDAAMLQSNLPMANYVVEVGDTGSGAGSVLAELYDATSGAFSASTPRLINVSVRKDIPSGGDLTVGFYVGGGAPKTVLIRAVGPTLGAAPFNIPGVMVDPQLTLFNSNQNAIAGNNDWGGDPALAAVSTRVGAFALVNPGSRDAVLLTTLANGSYTARATGVGTSSGTAIIEVYEVP